MSYTRVEKSNTIRNDVDMEPIATAADPAGVGTNEFHAISECIKTWEIHVPGAYNGYCLANGDHVRAILDSLAEYGLTIQFDPRLYKLKHPEYVD